MYGPVPSPYCVSGLDHIAVLHTVVGNQQSALFKQPYYLRKKEYILSLGRIKKNKIVPSRLKFRQDIFSVTLTESYLSKAPDTAFIIRQFNRRFISVGITARVLRKILPRSHESRLGKGPVDRERALRKIRSGAPSRPKRAFSSGRTMKPL